MPPRALANGGSDECQFFYKVGSCRHGNKCVRKHTIPSASKAIVFAGILLPGNKTSARSVAQNAQSVKDIFTEVALIAPIKEIFVAANDSPHLRGSVYISFPSESDAAKVLRNVNSRWFSESPVFAHYLPSQMLAMAVCREGDRCQRQLDCNYAHPLQLDSNIWAELFAAQAKEYQNRKTV